MAEKKIDILEAFAGATAEDLERIRAKKEDLQKQIDGLAQIEKALDVLINGKKERKKPERKAGNVSMISEFNLMERRKKVVAYLAANGSKSLQKISESVGIAKVGQGCLSTVLNHEWFHIDSQGIVSLTSKGDRAISA